MISQMSNSCIKSILSSWKDSLSLFFPKNFKLFFLVTLNALIKGAFVFFRYFGWIFVLTCAIFFYGLSWMDAPTLSIVIVYFLSTAVGIFICFAAYILAIRPSMHIKDYAYFKDYKGHIVTILLAMLFFLLGTLFLTTLYILLKISLFFVFQKSGITIFSFNSINQWFNYAWIPLVEIFGYPAISPIFFSPLFLTTVFFIFDLPDTKRSIGKMIVRAITMIVYNMPLYYISCMIFLLLHQGLLFFLFFVKRNVLWYFINVVISVSLTTLFYAFYITWFMNIYIKRLHDQYNLYEN